MFTSYAQNFEDIILWRALKHVGRGFYIDVGAQDPVTDSVSLAFYEHGWRGVHVEPSAQYAEKLRRARPDEEVIQAAVGREAGEIAIYEIPETGLSTGDEEIAKKHEAEGKTVKRVAVPCLRLAKILDSHKENAIHWLKIDVEGMEEAVIDGWRPSKVRPWIVVVESTIPNLPEQNHMSWEPRLLKRGYEFVYFDGLNRFYVSHEHPELKDSFGPGPNYFDYFTLTRASPFCQEINAEFSGLRVKLAEEEKNKAAVEAQLVESQTVRADLARQLEDEVSADARLEANFVTAMEKALAAEAANIRASLDPALREAKAAYSETIVAIEKALAAQAMEAANNRAWLDTALREVKTAHAETIAALEAARVAHSEAMERLSQEQAAHAATTAALETTRNELHEIHQANHHHWQLAEARAAEIVALRNSMSWRVTAPPRAVSRALRWVVRGPRWFFSGVWAWVTLRPGSRPRRVVGRAIGAATSFVRSQPLLYRMGRYASRAFPSLREYSAPYVQPEKTYQLDTDDLQEPVVRRTGNRSCVLHPDYFSHVGFVDFGKPFKLGYNTDLIRAIRCDPLAMHDISEFSTDEIIVHYYLALLKRYPSPGDVNRISLIIKQQGFESFPAIANGILKSYEYSIRGWREVKEI